MHNAERVPEGIESWTPGLAREPRRVAPGRLSMTEEERAALESRNRVGLVGDEPHVLVVPRRAVRALVPVRHRGRVTGVVPGRVYVGEVRDADELQGLRDAAEILSVPWPGLVTS